MLFKAVDCRCGDQLADQFTELGMNVDPRTGNLVRTRAYHLENDLDEDWIGE